MRQQLFGYPIKTVRAPNAIGHLSSVRWHDEKIVIATKYCKITDNIGDLHTAGIDSFIIVFENLSHISIINTDLLSFTIHRKGMNPSELMGSISIVVELFQKITLTIE